MIAVITHYCQRCGDYFLYSEWEYSVDENGRIVLVHTACGWVLVPEERGGVAG